MLLPEECVVLSDVHQASFEQYFLLRSSFEKLGYYNVFTNPDGIKIFVCCEI